MTFWFPPDYMIERLIKEGMLQELNCLWNPQYFQPGRRCRTCYDPKNAYSVPYFWGSVGIVYNHNNVDPAVVEEAATTSCTTQITKVKSMCMTERVPS